MLGFSNTQLRDRTCVLFRCNSPEGLRAVVGRWGNLDKIPLAKRMKRTGLLFSGIRPVPWTLARPLSHGQTDDVERDGYVFTDGCGLVSPRVVAHVSRAISIKFRGERYHPSVLQFRCAILVGGWWAAAAQAWKWVWRYRRWWW